MAPPSGTHTVVKTVTNIIGSESARAVVGAITYSNAFQGPPNAFTNNGQGTSAPAR